MPWPVIEKTIEYCTYCKSYKMRVAAIGKCTRDDASYVCMRHFRSAQGCGFQPRLLVQKTPCIRDKPLTLEELERLVLHQGDCAAAGVGCGVHGGATCSGD